MLAWVEAAFSSAWAFEVGRALESAPPGAHVAASRTDGTMVAFAAYDGNNRGLGEFGPAGTAVAHRGVGLGLALLLRCLLDMATAGHAEAGIPWVSVGGFYARAVDAVPRRRFVALERELLEA